MDEVYGITPTQPIFRMNDRIPSKFLKSKKCCEWLLSEDHLQLYRCRSEQQWEIWLPIGFGRTRTGRSTFRFSTITNTENIQGTLHASVQRRTNLAATLQSIGTFEESSADLQSNIRNIRGIPFPTNDWALQHIKVPTDQGKFFCELIKNHTATTCGDGSMKQQRATGSFLGFHEHNMDLKIKASCAVPVAPEDTSSYCGECGGILSAVTYVNILCTFHNVDSGTITHGVDNDAALRNCFGPIEPTTRTPCFHIVKRIRAEIKKSPITWIGHKVKAHQDKHTKFQDLDPWGKANVLADHDAKAHWRRT